MKKLFNLSFIKLLNLSSIKSYISSFQLGVLPPKPHQFVTHSLQSSLEGNLSEIVNSINILMPQLSEFINQFHTVISENHVNVFSDAYGNMSIDVPTTMSDAEGERLSQRIGVIDRIIAARSQEIETLVHKGLEVESKIKTSDPNFNSQILSKVNELKRLNDSYKH
jgi:hypothetical protein